MREASCRARDGRALGFAEYGEPAGAPVFFCHGWLGSRLDARPLEQTARALGARIVAIDRPGCGLSTRRAGRRLLDWPDDLLDVADHLAVERFAVLGWSFGGPFAAACALGCRERVTGIGLVSPIGPLDGPLAGRGLPGPAWPALSLAARLPWILPPYVGAFAWALKQPTLFAALMRLALPRDESALLSTPAFAGAADSAAEMLRHGSAGACDDALAFARPWGFGLDEIEAPTWLWHGEADRNVPPRMGKRYAAAIAGCQASFVPAAGHLLLFRRAEEILQRLVASHGRGGAA